MERQKNIKKSATGNSHYNGFGHWVEWKDGFVFGMIWQIRRMGLNLIKNPLIARTLYCILTTTTTTTT